MIPAEARPTTYRWAGRDEWMLTQPGDGDRHVLIFQPLFGELNRSRRLLRDVMRGLARRGIGSSLPDLPGTGESPRPLADCDWSDWTGAASAACAATGTERPHLAAIRGGALLDGVAGASRWRLAPVAGAALLRDLRRTQAMGDDASAETGIGLAGFHLSAALTAALEGAEPASAPPLRTVRLEGDPGAADASIAGPALWRRAEPGGSPELAEAIAADIAAWIELCAGC